jgi:hypothetical protein
MKRKKEYSSNLQNCIKIATKQETENKSKCKQ